MNKISKTGRYLIIFVSVLIHTHSYCQQVSTVVIESGKYIPLYGNDTSLVVVNDFKMDVYPVTNTQYLSFVFKNPEWQKSLVKRLFADENYLQTWDNDSTLGRNISPMSPVTNISWFAAKEYCKCKGKRLPTVDEWEYVAMAGQNKRDGREDNIFNQYILSWYEAPKTYDKEIGNTFKNIWGVYDLHGLVWEWTLNFNSILITGESRGDADVDKNLFCASGAVGATDLMNYAAFMRYAFRGSLKANYAIKNLGFRCVKDI